MTKRDLLDKLFKLHKIYARQKNNAKRIRVADACEPVFLELKKLGVSRGFSEVFLCYGNRFLLFEFGVEWIVQR